MAFVVIRQRAEEQPGPRTDADAFGGFAARVVADDAAEDAPDEGDTRPVVVVRVPTRFAMARWDRDPLAAALRGAEATLGVRVRLVLA